MGWVALAAQVVGSYMSSRSASKGAQAAANAQVAAGDQSIAFMREQAGIARKDLQPYAELGAGTIGDLQAMTTLEGQQEYLQNEPTYQALSAFQPRDVTYGAQSNPIFDQAANEAMRRVEERRSSMGKLGSGGTLVDLTNASAMTRHGLEMDRLQVDQSENAAQFQRLLEAARVRSGLATDQYNRLLTSVNIGQASAAGQAANAQQLGSNVANINLQQGNAAAAGLVGVANAKGQFYSDLGKIAGAYFGGGA